MKLTIVLGSLALLATTAAAQNTTNPILAACNAKHDACDVAPNANHAYCASEFFGCLLATDHCNCRAVQTSCFANATNIFNCAQPIADCVIACNNKSPSSNSTSTTVTVVPPPPHVTTAVTYIKPSHTSWSNVSFTSATLTTVVLPTTAVVVPPPVSLTTIALPTTAVVVVPPPVTRIPSGTGAITPTFVGTGTPILPTSTRATVISPPIFTGAASRNGASIAGVLAIGAALLF